MKKNKLLFIVLFLTFSSSRAQDYKVCAYNSYVSSSEYIEMYGLREDSQETPFQIQVDILMKKIGIVRNFDWRSNKSNYPTTAAIIDPYFGSLERYVGYSNEIICDFEKNPETYWRKTASLWHAMGHQINKHVLLEGVSTEKEELEAHRFVGYVLGYFGMTKEFVLINFPNTNSDIGQTSFSEAFGNKGIFEGWESFMNGEPIINKEDILELRSFDQTTINKYTDIAETYAGKPDKYTLCAQAWLNVFRYSNGRFKEALYNATVYYILGGQVQKGMEYGYELLGQGVNFLNSQGKVEIFRGIASGLYENNRNKEALNYTEIALNLDSANFETLMLASKICLELKDWENRLKYLKELVKLKPSFTSLYNQLGETYFNFGNTEKAIRMYERGLTIDPSFLLSRLHLAKLYSNLAEELVLLDKRKIKNKTWYGLYAKSIEVLEEGKTTNPNSSAIENALNKIYEKIEKKKITRQVNKAKSRN